MALMPRAAHASPARTFAVLYAGQLAAVMAAGLLRFALGVWVFERTQDPALTTTLLLCATAALSLGAIVGGPLSDRADRRTILLAANAVSLLSVGMAALLHAAGALAVWHLAVVLLVGGAASAFIIPAFEASIPALVPQAQLGRAAGLSQLMQAAQTIVAPVLAVALLNARGLGGVFAVCLAALGLTLLSVKQVALPARAKRAPTSWLAGLRDGLAYLRATPPFQALLGFAASAMFLFAGVFYALATPYILTFAGAGALSAAVAAFGVGALGAGLLLSITGGPRRTMNAMLSAVAVAGVGALVCAATRAVPLVVGAFFVIGFSFMTMFGLNRALWQVKAPPHLIGRLLSLRLTCTSMAQAIGVGVAGPLAAWLAAPLGLADGIALLYTLIGVAALVLVALAAATPAVRHLDRLLPDAALHHEDAP